MGGFLAGLIPKFLADFFLGVFKDLMRKAKLKQQGRTEQELEQSKATVEVISRNQEGQDAVDNMTEQELQDFLTKK